MSAACLLCGSTDLRRLAALDPQVLRVAYRDTYDVEITLPPLDNIEYLLCTSCDLRFFLPPVAGPAEFYRQLQKIPWYYRDEKAEYDIAAWHIGPADAVLEVGAGKGVFARHIRCRSYAGLETSPDAVAIARGEGVDLRQEDLQTHSSRNPGRYDVVCAFQVLEHVPDPLSFLQSACGALRSRGRLIVAVPSEDSFASIDFWDVLNMPPHHVTRWSDRSLRSAARLVRLDTVAIEHEPLPDRDVHWYVKTMTEYGMALRLGHEPTLLDPYMRRWLIRRGSKLAASLLRRAMRHAALRPVGHAVIAVYQKES
ncbi:MAG TPA: class I SAM-dependent methyltransferase [Steroidobacteraceae bacterium]|nr:class I SAM-dependent methyltransferase [Steroidobacteraceae bacterium]